MARAALGLSVKKLAVAARVAPQTIVRFERGDKIRASTVTSLRQVLEAAGVEFTDCNDWRSIDGLRRVKLAQGALRILRGEKPVETP